MRSALRPRPGLLPLTVLLLCSGCILVSSCILVRVEGDLPEEEWFSDVVHGGAAAPASFHHGRADVTFAGSLLGVKASLEMKFSCAPEDLAAYLDGVCSEVQAQLREERDATILEVSTKGPNRRYVEYDGKEGYGEVEIVAVELEAGRPYRYRLEIDWHE